MDGVFRTRHVFASSLDSSGFGMVSMVGTVMAMIVTCAAISAMKSVMMKTSRVLLRP